MIGTLVDELTQHNSTIHKYPLVMTAKPQAQLLHDSAVRLLRVLPVAKKAGQTILLQREHLRAVRIPVQKAVKPHE